MTAARLMRVFAALVFAVFAAALWATPGEAHAGHGGAGAPASVAHMGPAVEPAPRHAAQPAAHADAPASAASEGCSGSVGPKDVPSCCSAACHAVMAQELPGLMALAIRRASAPSQPEPEAQGAPSAHLKRPPRPLAAMVG